MAPQISCWEVIFWGAAKFSFSQAESRFLRVAPAHFRVTVTTPYALRGPDLITTEAKLSTAGDQCTARSG
jgi:hypothetical protein